MEEYSKIEGKEVPSIHSKTGVSQDYCNQINGVAGLFKNKGIDSVKDRLKKSPIYVKKYEEAYFGCKNVVNDKNRKSIKRLDELAVQMNEILKDIDSINEDAFRKICNEMYFLIYGDRSIKI